MPTFNEFEHKIVQIFQSSDTTAPAVAAFARTNFISTVHNQSYDDIPQWFKKWEKTGLIKWDDKNSDGLT